MNPYKTKRRRRNPREDANIVSLLSFIYTKDIFGKGYKRDLENEDIYEVIKSCNSHRVGVKLETQWYSETKEEWLPSVYKLLWKRYGFRYILVAIVDLIHKLGYSIILPYISSKFISYFKPGQTEISQQEAYFYVICMMAFIVVNCLYLHNFLQWVHGFAIEMKTAFSSLLYRKALRLTPSALNEINLGNIVTLIIKDVHIFGNSIFTINELWNGIIQTIIVCFLLYIQIGVVTFIGIGILLSAVLLQVIIGKYISKLRLATGKKTDDRVQITKETLSAIRTIKMYTWENFFSNQISAARK